MQQNELGPVSKEDLLQVGDIEVVDWSLARECLHYTMDRGQGGRKTTVTQETVIQAFQEAQSWLNAITQPHWAALERAMKHKSDAALTKIVTARGDDVAWLQGYLAGLEAIKLLPEGAKQTARKVMAAVEARHRREVE